MDIILSSSSKESSDFARLAELKPRTWRHVFEAADLRGARAERVYVLPGYARNPRRFTIDSKLRYLDAERVEITEEKLDDLRAERAPQPVVSQWRGVGEQLPLFGDEPKKPAKKATARKPKAETVPAIDDFFDA